MCSWLTAFKVIAAAVFDRGPLSSSRRRSSCQAPGDAASSDDNSRKSSRTEVQRLALLLLPLTEQHAAGGQQGQLLVLRVEIVLGVHAIGQHQQQGSNCLKYV